MLDNARKGYLFARMRYRLSAIPSGVAGTDATVREIARLVRYDLERPQLRLLATRVLNHARIRSKNHLQEAKTLYGYIVGRVRYQKDPVDLETVQSPTVTLGLGAGDCDDLSGLVAGLAMAVGMPARFRVIGYGDNDLVHIFPELFAAGRWWPADATEPHRGFGWRPKRFPVERVYNLNGEVQNMAELEKEKQYTRGQVKGSIAKAVTDTLSSNWQAGLIDLADVRGYLGVIEEGNFPTREPLVVEPTEGAIREFIDYVVENRVGSLKPAGSLGGVDGFLSSIWDASKKVVSSYVAQAPGERVPLIHVSPTVTVPQDVIRAEATPAVARAFGAGLGGATMPLLIAAGLALMFVLKR